MQKLQYARTSPVDVVFFEKYCQYSDLLLLESRLEVGVGVLVHATSLVPAPEPEDAELTERTKAGFEPKGWLSFNVDGGSAVGWVGGSGMAGVTPIAATTVPELERQINVPVSPICSYITIPPAAIDEDSTGKRQAKGKLLALADFLEGWADCPHCSY